jgi:benzoate membrane transport protein
VVTAAGLALFGTLASSLTAALMDEGHREAALLTFVVAASGVTIAGLGSPLWAVLAGGSVSWLLKARPKSTPAIKPVMQGKN